MLYGSLWRPTTAMVRAGLGSLALAIGAVTTGRPDLLVIAAPLLVHAVATLRRAPTTAPTVTSRLGTPHVQEGEGTRLHVHFEGTGGIEHALVALTAHRQVATQPASGLVGHTTEEPAGTVDVEVPVAGLRWGRRRVGDGSVAATTAWGGYRWGPVPLLALPLTVLPHPGVYDGRAASPHPIGLVGQHPARRRGQGSELESIRPFRPGDRLRRLQWPVSLRTGTLHVTSTLAEEDASVLLVVDSGVEVGVSGGAAGPSSTLDVAVRAAAAVAEHYLRNGDRVGLRVLGASAHNAVHTAAGRRHYRRVLDTLASVVPGENRHLDPSRLRFDAPAGTIVLVFSPMLSDTAVAATLTLAARGLDVVIVDCLPVDLDLGEDDPYLRLAWRMRMLERSTVLGRFQHTGTPVVAWRGPGTLDDVLRQLSRRASRPRPRAGRR